MNVARRRAIAWILNLLAPGLGYVFLREYVFGLFVFLITLLGVITCVALMILRLPTWSEIVLLGLPTLFYLFTFVDINRTVKRVPRRPNDSLRAAVVLLLVGLAYFSFAPSGIGNLVWRNRPEFFVLHDSTLAPRYSQGDLVLVNSLEYYVDVAVVDHPIMHAMPSRLDIIRYRDDDGNAETGVVLGLPGEEVEVITGVLIVNGVIYEGLSPTGMRMTGDLPLTQVGSRSILVAEFRLGSLVRAKQVELTQIRGKVVQPW